MLKGVAFYLGLMLPALSVCLPAAAQQLSPEWTRCVDRGKTFSHDEQIRGCTAVLQSGRETTANRAIAYANRGAAYNDKRDYDRAIADYSEAIRLNPRNASAYVNRGVAYGAKRDNDRAIADYREAIRLNPSHANAYYNRAIAYAALGRREEAIADFRRTLSINPNIHESREALKRLGASP